MTQNDGPFLLWYMLLWLPSIKLFWHIGCVSVEELVDMLYDVMMWSFKLLYPPLSLWYKLYPCHFWVFTLPRILRVPPLSPTLVPSSIHHLPLTSPTAARARSSNKPSRSQHQRPRHSATALLCPRRHCCCYYYYFQRHRLLPLLLLAAEAIACWVDTLLIKTLKPLYSAVNSAPSALAATLPLN